MTTHDVLDGLVSDPTSANDSNTPSNEEITTTDSNETSTTNGETQDDNVLDEVPADLKVMSITEFAAHMTQHLMLQAVQNGEPVDPSKHYVVPQSVYQTVKAQREQIPHIKVRTSDDKEARVYITVDAATEWWLDRVERLATRGSGTARASSRTAEQNLALLNDAAFRHRHAETRSALWTERIDQTARLLDKYRGFLDDQDVSEDEIAKAVQDGIDRYDTEAAEKASNRKKSDNTDS